MKKNRIALVTITIVVIGLLMVNYVSKKGGNIDVKQSIPRDFQVKSVFMSKRIDEIINKKTEDDLDVIQPMIDKINGMKFIELNSLLYKDIYYTIIFYNNKNEHIEINIINDSEVDWVRSIRVKDSNTNTYHFKSERMQYKLIDAKFDFDEFDMYFKSLGNSLS